MKKFFITTPIYYVNDRVHCGHCYTTIAADILARYYRLKKNDVFFLVGTDEHGAKIEQAAQKQNKTPQKLCDENSERFKKIWKELNISYNRFIRTSDENHKKTVQRVLDFFYKKKLIYKGIYQGLYCLGCEQYKTKNDLINGKCPHHQKEPEIINEKSYLFKLLKFEKAIEKKIKNNQIKIEPEFRKKEILKFLEKGLEDISVSRQNVKWGIALPFDKKFTIYVWIDAFLNYLTGLNWKGNPKKLPKFWPPNIQLMAKDIFRVHTTIWPALLLGLKIPLPKLLFIHGFFTSEGQKMSKSLGNVIWPEELIEKFGAEASRYLLISSCSFGKDSDITLEKLKNKYEADLAKGLGNFVSRVIGLADKFKIKNTKTNNKIKNRQLKEELEKTRKKYEKDLRELKFKEALISIWDLISFCDRYLEKEKPWENKKQETGNRKQETINNLLLVIKEIALMLQPFLPTTSKKISQQLKTKETEILFPRLITKP